MIGTTYETKETRRRYGNVLLVSAVVCLIVAGVCLNLLISIEADISKELRAANDKRAANETILMESNARYRIVNKVLNRGPIDEMLHRRKIQKEMEVEALKHASVVEQIRASRRGETNVYRWVMILCAVSSLGCFTAGVMSRR